MDQTATALLMQGATDEQIAEGWRVGRSARDCDLIAKLAKSYDMSVEDYLADFSKHGELRIVLGLASGEFVLNRDGEPVCSFCGGNCGQCGDTDILGNVPFSFDKIVESFHRRPVPQTPSRTISAPDKPARCWMDTAGYGLVIGAAIAFVLIALAGCSATPGHPYYTPAVLINGFDPTLTSHQKALGLDHAAL